MQCHAVVTSCEKGEWPVVWPLTKVNWANIPLSTPNISLCLFIDRIVMFLYRMILHLFKSL